MRRKALSILRRSKGKKKYGGQHKIWNWKKEYFYGAVPFLKLFAGILFFLAAAGFFLGRSSWETLYLKETLPFFSWELSNKDTKEIAPKTEPTQTAQILPTFENWDMLKSPQDFKQYIYTIDATAYVSDSLLQEDILKTFHGVDDLKNTEPKILIFHTHSQEDFADSEAGNPEDTIVGVGNRLATILSENYGITVVHDVESFDLKDGQPNRNGSYETMEPAIEKVLEKYPSIEVCIDLHRDGVAEDIRLVTEINGKPTAKIMFFNGVCCLNDNGLPKPTQGLENPYLKENLAFSFHMQMMANTLYPDFTRRIYIKPYRYSLHFKPLSLLVEVGANTNTVEEAKNAMEPLAEILVQVLEEKA